MNNRLYINQIRTIGILFVVLWHTYTICFPTLEFKKYLEPFAAMMPMLTFISGYLFALLYKEGRYSNYKRMLQKKALRLLLPLLIFTPFYVDYNNLSLLTLLEISNGVGPLWFLIMLFWQFVFCWLFYRYIIDRLDSSLLKFFCVLPFFFLIYLPCPEILGIASFFRYVFYFLLGRVISDMEILKHIIRQKFLSCFIIIFLLSLILICEMIIPTNQICKIIGGNFLRFSSIGLVGLFCYTCQSKVNVILKELDKNSFGIYLIHSLILYMFVHLGYNVNPFVVCVLSIICAYIITKLIKLTKMGYIIS